MSESPGIIGRHRPPQRALPLGHTEPIGRPFDAPPLDRTEPKSAQEMADAHTAWLDEQLIATSCGLCDWRFDGTAAEGRDAALAHRVAEHPEAAHRRTVRKRGISRPDVKLSAADYEEAQRARAEKDEAARLATIARGRQRVAREAVAAGELDEPGLEETPKLIALGPDGAGVSSNPDDNATTSTEEDEMRGNAQESPAKDRWTPDEILRAIRAHAAETGFVPIGRDFAGPSTDERPNIMLVKRAFGTWADAVETAGYPRPRRGGKPVAIANLEGSGWEPKAEDAAGTDEPEPERTVSPPAAGTAEEASHPDDSTAIVVVREQFRDPKRNADIPYDADLLQDEAEFLRRRADALDAIATGVRQLAELTEERLAA